MSDSLYENMKNKFFFISGPNVIENEEHVLYMAKQIKEIMDKFDVIYIFKTSFDKANRTSLNSYRGVGLEKGIEILKKVKEQYNLPICTDIHESCQAEKLAKVADIIQIPAFLCRQTDLLEAAAKTGKIIHVKKGQFCSAQVMHKSKEKIIAFGNNKVILCERGNMFGYNDLIVDPRNLVWLKSNTNLVSMDITHCLQQPAQVKADGTICSGGLREMIPWMGKLAKAFGVNGIFMEVHDRPDESLCDAPTQFPLDKLYNFVIDLGFNDISKTKFYESSGVGKIPYTLGCIEADANGDYGKFDKENMRGEKILDMLLEEKFSTILDIGGGEMKHAKKMIEKGKLVDVCDIGRSEYYNNKIDCDIRNMIIGDFNEINFTEKYDAIWCSHILEHQLNPNLFLKKVNSVLNEGGYFGIVVPPRKPFIVDGHISLWNAGLVLYHLILAGFDCSEYCKIKQYDYNIGIIIKKKSIIDMPKLAYDTGDIERLKHFFPFDAKKGFNGDIFEL
jgi:2-dehydro-3-deoxyphosphooctonate aldolase (KDO 8-P synthase)